MQRSVSKPDKKPIDFWSSLPPINVAAARARMRWIKTARPEQLTPEGDWRIWLILAGRGWGKTRTGAEDAAHYALWHEGARLAVVAPTYADARDTCVEGDSGLLSVIPPLCVRAWNRSLGELVLVNGSRFKLFSADRPERLRGPQHHRAWADELAAWPAPETLDQVLFGLRLGIDPRLIVTTTPKPVPLVVQLTEREGRDVRVTRGTTYDNARHLAPAALAQLRERYEGTRLGRQELHADLLQDVQGALWTHEQCDRCRIPTPPPLARVVIAIDPAMGAGGSDGDETGIIAAGRDTQGRITVLADGSGHYSPDAWARMAVGLFHEWSAHLVVAEVNEGGALVERVLRMVEPHLPFKALRALRGKVARALPVAALYEQGRMQHWSGGGLDALEDQMCRFTHQGLAGGKHRSPDRVDALVWAVTELMQDDLHSPPRIRLG